MPCVSSIDTEPIQQANSGGKDAGVKLLKVARAVTSASARDWKENVTQNSVDPTKPGSMVDHVSFSSIQMLIIMQDGYAKMYAFLAIDDTHCLPGRLHKCPNSALQQSKYPVSI